jgi:DNA-binding NtrC family response regulator
VDAAIGRFNASAARPVTGVSAEVLDMLYDHDWPGNLRELEGVLSGALILAGGSELRPEHLTLELDAPGAGAASRSERPLNPRQEVSLEGLRVGDRISSAEYAEAHGVSARTALRDLMELADGGYLVREGRKRGTRFRRSKKARGASSVQ